MRILVVNNVYPPHSLGGYEDLCAGAVAAWRDAGHEVLVLTSAWRRSDVTHDVPPHGETVDRRLPLYWNDHEVLRPSLRTCLAWERSTRDIVWEAIESFRPDVASLWNMSALSFGIFTYLAQSGVPVVAVLGERWLHFGPYADRWARRFRHRPVRMLGQALTAATGLATFPTDLGDRTIACFATDHLRDHALATTTWRFVATPVVPHGLDLKRFVADGPSAAQTWQGRLLYVGRIEERKGIATTLRAIASMPDTRLDLAGGGDQHHLKDLEHLVRDLGIGDRVNFHGHLGAEQVAERYRRADALIFPSEWEEPFGIVPLEAMASGLPVISTGTGGSGEFLLPDVTSVRFQAGDHQDLTHAVARLAEDPELRRHLVAAGRRLASWLARAKTYEELEAWHRFAIDGSATSPPPRPMVPPDLGAAYLAAR